MARIVLILSVGILIVFPIDVMIVDLADFDIGINPYRLDTKDFKGPVAGKADVTKTGRDVNEDTETADRRPTFEHGDVAVGPVYSLVRPK
mgnify:CR=1 FL=1